MIFKKIDEFWIQIRTSEIQNERPRIAWSLQAHWLKSLTIFFLDDNKELVFYEDDPANLERSQMSNPTKSIKYIKPKFAYRMANGFCLVEDSTERFEEIEPLS